MRYEVTFDCMKSGVYATYTLTSAHPITSTTSDWTAKPPVQTVFAGEYEIGIYAMCELQSKDGESIGALYPSCNYLPITFIDGVGIAQSKPSNEYQMVYLMTS